MVFVNPSVRLARHRRLAVALRRHLDGLLVPIGWTYAHTEIEKTHVRIGFRMGDAELLMTESDHHESTGTQYCLSAAGHEVTFAQESELPQALAALIALVKPALRPSENEPPTRQ